MDSRERRLGNVLHAQAFEPRSVCFARAERTDIEAFASERRLDTFIVDIGTCDSTTIAV